MRIHFALRRELGESVDVGRMLNDRAYADEMLDLCRAIPDHTLVDLADRFDDASAAENARLHMAAAARRARLELSRIPRRGPAMTPQTMEWSRHTSGFGWSQPLSDMPSTEQEAAPVEPAARRWFSPSDWFGLSRSSIARH